MSLTTLEEKVLKYEPCPELILDALKTLKYSPLQTNPRKVNDDKNSPTRGRVGMKLEPRRNVGYKRPTGEFTPLVRLKRNQTRVDVQPLGMARGHRIAQNMNLIPTLRKLDMETEKEREIQRVMNNLRLSCKNSQQRTTSTLAKRKDALEALAVSSSKKEIASSLIEGHNLTLKQLREFWSQMPSYLNIHAATLKNKYGIFEKDSTDIDDISIAIVRKWNEPITGTILPDITVKTTTSLNTIQEEKSSLDYDSSLLD